MVLKYDSGIEKCHQKYASPRCCCFVFVFVFFFCYCYWRWYSFSSPRGSSSLDPSQRDVVFPGALENDSNNLCVAIVNNRMAARVQRKREASCWPFSNANSTNTRHLRILLSRLGSSNGSLGFNVRFPLQVNRLLCLQSRSRFLNSQTHLSASEMLRINSCVWFVHSRVSYREPARQQKVKQEANLFWFKQN